MDENEEIQEEKKPDGWRDLGWWPKTCIVLFVALLLWVAGNVLFHSLLNDHILAAPGDTIALSAAERAESQKLAEHRQDIQLRRNKALADYQAQLNRLNEEETQVNLESQTMCFEMKKAHKLDPKAQYQLDEWNGRLVKQ